MVTDLTGKRAIICGSTQGIGKAAAKELALLGASITLIARNEEMLKQVISELPADDTESHNFIVADFNDPESLKPGLERLLQEHPIDILINNTGGPPAGPALEASLAEYTSAFTNHLLCNQVLTQGLGVSNTIRGAVANWAKTLSIELAPFGITVNNVLPGMTRTGRLESLIASRAETSGRSKHEIELEMLREIPAGRFAEAEEVAAAIAFLAMPAAAYINGINIPVDGGKTPSL